MKKIFTTTLFAALTIVLSAQVNFEPAHSLMNDNATASINFDYSFTSNETTSEEEVKAASEKDLEEVENEFNIVFSANSYFEDVTISYELAEKASVTLEISKEGSDTFELVERNTKQEGGIQQILWDQNVSPGIYTIRLIVDSKVETKKLRLSSK